MSVAEAFAVIAQSCIRHFRLNEPLVIRGRVPEALHQTRVAMRRLRAALSVFRPAIKDDQFEPLRGELRWFTGQLGGARNLDVYLEQKRISREVRKALKRERKLAYDRVAEALQSERLRILMIDLAAWIENGRWRRNEKALRPLPAYSTRRIGRLWRKVAAHGELKPMHGEERHELRIEVKKLRYALEFVEPLNTGAGRRKKQFTKAIEALQDSLGVLNDLVTAQSIATLVGDTRELERLDSADLHRKCVHEAQACLDKLRKVGPYWSKSRSDGQKRVQDG
jgi:CHAD domain-containing protein